MVINKINSVKVTKTYTKYQKGTNILTIIYNDNEEFNYDSRYDIVNYNLLLLLYTYYIVLDTYCKLDTYARLIDALEGEVNWEANRLYTFKTLISNVNYPDNTLTAKTSELKESIEIDWEQQDAIKLNIIDFKIKYLDDTIP